MASSSRDKVLKMYKKRGKLEIELQKIHATIEQSIQKSDRRAKVETLVQQCEKIATDALEVNDQILDHANKTSQKPTVIEELEKWVKDTTEKNQLWLQYARGYLDQRTHQNIAIEKANSHHSMESKVGRKSNASKASGSSFSRGLSLTSSQKRKELLIAKARREEVEKENEISLLLARKRHEMKRLHEQQMAEIELEELQEANRKKLAEAKLFELELQDPDTQEEDIVDELPGLDFNTAVGQRVSDWVDKVPPGSRALTPFDSGDLLTANANLESSAVRVKPALGASFAVPISPTSAATPQTRSSLINLHELFYPSSTSSQRAPSPKPSNAIYVGAALHTETSVVNSTPSGGISLYVRGPDSLFNSGNPIPQPEPSAPLGTTRPQANADPQFAQGLRRNPPQICPQFQNSSRPISHLAPNLDSWNFVNAPPCGQESSLAALGAGGVRSASAHHVGQVTHRTSGGMVYYDYAAPRPATATIGHESFDHQNPGARGNASTQNDFPVYANQEAAIVPPHSINVKDLSELFSFSRRDPLPEWKLEKYDGNPLQWHEWYGQFKSAVDSATLSDDVKLTYLKTLTTGRAKAAIAEFAYCGVMYRDALRTLERKFGQPQAVVGAHVEKLTNHPPIKIHNSEAIISYSMTIASLVSVLRSLSFESDLKSSAVLNLAIQKLPPNLKEGWSSFVIRKKWVQPTLLEFNDWLREKADAHDLMKLASSKPTGVEANSAAVKSKTSTKTFASNEKPTAKNNPQTNKDTKVDLNCLVCKGKHQIWKCAAFKEKSSTQRAKFAGENKLCFSCLNGQHTSRYCPNPRKCAKEGCDKSHNTLLHGAERVFAPSKGASGKNVSENSSSGAPGNVRESDEISKSNGFPSVSKVKGLLQLVEVEFLSATKKTNALVLCDSACSHSWVTKSLANRLSVQGSPLTVTVNGINSQQTIETKVFDLTVRALEDDEEESFAFTPYLRETINVGSDSIDVETLKKRFPHLEPIKASCYNYGDVEAILGQDIYQAIRPLEYFQADSQVAPLAVRLPLGWVLSGPLATSSCALSTCLKASVQEDQLLVDQIRTWYDIESFGSFKQVDNRSANDAKALEVLEWTTTHDGDRYSVGMLWADDKSQLPNNFYSTLAQMKSLEKRFEKDPVLKQKYSDTISDDFEKGFMVKVNKEVSASNKREWYLPHHPVLNPNKPGKVRRVLNGASKFHGHSLNSALLTGPDLLQSLFHVILRFRQFPCAVSADIEGMFLQVGVPVEDQPSLRFLWREDPSKDVVVYQYTRHIFGAKDSPTCANYALQRTAADNRSEYPDASRAVEEKFYMDDYLDSLSSTEKALQRSQDLKKLLKLGGFKLTKFVSNVSALALELNESKVDCDSKEFAAESESDSHVLGLRWNTKSDTLVVSRGLDKVIDKLLTQRMVLSLVSSIFDPIGLVAPFTIKARLLLKEIWRLHGQSWDEELPDEIRSKFHIWCSDLPKLASFTIPRCFFKETPTDYELHMFGDSSQDAIGAVAFLRGKSSTGPIPSTELAFVLGKARVAPMKALTIPKLELQASLLAARLRSEVHQALTLDISRTFMWTDSTTVLQWLNSSEKQPIFVANRVAEILDHSTVDEWFFVPTKDNPADVATRGLSADELGTSCWLKGPSFLKSTEWPFRPRLDFKRSLKVKSNIVDDDYTLGSPETISLLSANRPEPVINWKRFSSFPKLVRIVAYMFRLLRSSDIFRTQDGNVADPYELSRAEERMHFLVQSESFGDERKCLMKENSIPKSSRIVAYCPFMGPNGLLRSLGRLRNLVEADYNMKHPVILDAKHPFVRLFLIHLHREHGHQGVEYLRAFVQQKFAVLKLRSTLRSIQSACVVCRRRKAEFVAPPMADLPKDRLAFQSPPFHSTGVDYFGPLYVSIRRSTEKRWGFLFTCLTTRAVHFEIVSSMDTSSCVMGIERFIARRGFPSVIWSDNGTNFIGAEKELLQLVHNWDRAQISTSLVSKGIRWKFNPPAAPHHGGSWERIVRSFKRVFYAIIGSRRLTEEVLSTTFCLVEQLLNSRPICPVSSDPNDLNALTPNHFLLGRPGTFASTVPVTDNDFEHRKRYVRAQSYANAVWTRWLKEYVPSLQKRSKWNTSPNRELKAGDLVWIVESTSPRGLYPMARVLSLRYGPDGFARSAELRTASGSCVRPVVKLVPVLPSVPLGGEDVANCDSNGNDVMT